MTRALNELVTGPNRGATLALGDLIETMQGCALQPSGVVLPVALAQSLGVNLKEDSWVWGQPVTWVNAEDWGVICHTKQAPTVTWTAKMPQLPCPHKTVTWAFFSGQPECDNCHQTLWMYSKQDLDMIRAGAQHA